MKRIAVIGAGVNGLSAAVQIAEYYHDDPDVQVTLFADETTPNTTGDGSAGLWGPYLLGDTPSENIIKWSRRTHDFFRDLWLNGHAAECKICLIPVLRVSSDPKGYEPPLWKDIVFGYRHLSPLELNHLSMEHQRNYTTGVQFISFTCEPTGLLPYLFKRFENARGRFEHRLIRSLNELSKEGYDLIVNCSGLGARTLAKDENVKPIRGQVARIKAPWLKQVYISDDDDGNYIIPNVDDVVVGGTHQENDYNRNPDQKDSEFIFAGCSKIFPSIKNAIVKREWVGLRPGRMAVRLELDFIPTSKEGEKVPVIQNYGHGGSGVTLCWGCATDVLELAKQKIGFSSSEVPKSRL